MKEMNPPEIVRETVSNLNSGSICSKSGTVGVIVPLFLRKKQLWAENFKLIR